MGCLKCGKETEESQIFCNSCLETMEAYPIKPGTPVILPQRSSNPHHEKPSSRKELSPEHQLQYLRKLLRWFAGVIALLSVLLCITGVMLIRSLNKQSAPAPGIDNIGRNYTTTNKQP